MTPKGKKLGTLWDVAADETVRKEPAEPIKESEDQLIGQLESFESKKTTKGFQLNAD